MSAKEYVKIFIPCESFVIDVQLGPSESLTALERLVLEAIYKGLNHFDSLVDFFQIGYRPTFVLVVDLWRGGHIVVDVSSGHIDLTDSTKEKILKKQGQFDELNINYHTTETVTLCQELTSGYGHILPFKLDKGSKQDKYNTAPQSREFGSYLKTPLFSIIEAAYEFTRRIPRFKDRKIISASLKNEATPDGMRSVGPRFLEIHAEVYKNPSGSIKKLSIVSRKKLGDRVRRSLEDTLSKLANEKLDDIFVNYLLNNAQPESKEPDDTPELILEKLSKEAEKLSEIGNGNPSLHETLQDLGDRVRDPMARRFQERASLRLIPDAAELANTIKKEIRRAKHQIVMVCPWLDRAELNEYRKDISEALERGVQFFLMWGSNALDKVPDPVLRIFDDWRDRGDFHWANKSARTNERYFIRDWELEILTSAPFLSMGAKRDLAWSLEIRRPDFQPDWQLVNDQLNRAYRLAPDTKFIRKLIRFDPDENERDRSAGANEPLDAGDREDVIEPKEHRFEIPDIPSAPVIFEPSQWRDENERGALTQANLKVWKDNWKYWLAELKSRFNQIGDTAFLVHDSEHRELLLKTLGEAKSYLIMASEKLTSQGFDEELVQALLKAAKRGVSVHIIYGDIDATNQQTQSYLQQLTAAGSSKIATQVSCHGGLLIWEEGLMVTGFSILSKIGHDQNAGRAGIQYETGVFVRSRSLAQEAAKLIGDKISRPDALKIELQFPAPAIAPAEERIEDTTGKAIAAYLAEFWRQFSEQDILNEASKPAIEFFRNWFAGTAGDKGVIENQTIAQILDQLIPSLPSDLKKLAVANFLESYSRAFGGSAPVYQYWLRWLAGAAWQERNYIEAAVLLHQCQPYSHPELPPIWLAELAATQMRPRLFEGALAEVIIRPDLQEADIIAVSCLACKWLGFKKLELGEDVKDVLEVFCGRSLSEPLKMLMSSFIDYWNHAHQPIPLKFLASLEKLAEISARVNDKYNELLKLFKQTENINPADPVSVRATWEYIFKSDGKYFGRLQNWVKKRDLDEIEKWLKNFRNDFSDEGDFLDEATKNASTPPRPLLAPIVGQRRDACVRKLKKLLKEVRDWERDEQALKGIPQKEETVQFTRQWLDNLKKYRPQFESLVGEWRRRRFYQAPIAGELLEDLTKLLTKQEK